ncbi:GerA spore germination protein [Paenibacillus curdlanolyticus YK9]|uniref:GerA spore germination protein n=1 Tax=Paenibacillus curdlanolyticus YK9 TaxID=717606 RepID=E0I5T3_9BACL|nr:spore germination protein [Paenibacillus curdlanolyticus]EFM12325.1 GerA spore germination protein [Paenibacillus curdlanolyticus YK9]
MSSTNAGSTVMPRISDNLNAIRQALGNSNDIVIRELMLVSGQSAAIIYTDGLVDTQKIQQFIIESLTFDYGEHITLDMPEPIAQEPFPELLRRSILKAGDIQQHSSMKLTLRAIVSGFAVLLLDGYSCAIALDMKLFPDRQVSPSETEPGVRGPKDAFTENVRKNTALVRRRIKDPNLRIESYAIGRVTQTDVFVLYIKGIARDSVVEEARNRLKRIDTDAILESGYIEEMIQDSTWSPFPTVYNTERPDVTAAELLEGKVVVMIDGTPFVLVVPALFVSFFHASEDYYQRFDVSSLIRLLRFVGVFFSLLGPSLYIALTTFHQEMLPTQLIVSLVAQREGVPFPAFVEAMLMEITFEVLREAGVRMPRTFGPTVSFVGTLVIGQSAVEAGIVSPAMLIVVAFTAISSFVIPATSMSISLRMLRFPFMILSATFGLVGMMAGIIVLVLHLSSLRSFGVPYMSPLAPFTAQDVSDTLFRLPQWAMKARPRQVSQQNGNRNSLKRPQPNMASDNASDPANGEESGQG